MSGGLHGVGVSVVNALSSRLDVVVERDGYSWSQDYVDQKATAPLAKGAKTNRRGHDDHVLGRRDDLRDDHLLVRDDQPPAAGDGVPEQGADDHPARRAGDADRRRGRPGRSDQAAPKAAAKEITYQYPGGIADFVRHLNATKGAIHKSVISFEAEDKEQRLSVEVAMQWNDGYSESVYTFANTINTHEGGTHEEGFRAALTHGRQQVGRGEEDPQAERREADRR